MATLAALLAEVYKLTTRPDLDNLTTVAVKAATLKAHQSDFYPKDIFESGVTFSTVEYQQSLDYKAIIPRYRALKYLRKSDAEGVPGDFFVIATPEQTLDSYRVNREDIVYLAGAVLNIRSSTTFQYMLLGCYLNPDISDLGYDSWISEDHPYAIIFEAAATVFKGIGFDEMSASYSKMAMEQFAELKMDSVLANGW